VIVGDLVEWLGQALSAATETVRVEQPRPRSRRMELRDGLMSTSMTLALADAAGAVRLQSRRSALDDSVRFWGYCKCKQPFSLDISDDWMLVIDDRAAIQLLVDELHRAREATCHCIVKGSVPQQ
jgi:hypothetical protein